MQNEREGNLGMIAMDWIFISPPNSYAEAFIFNVMVFGGGAFGRQLGRKDGSLVNEISAPTEGP